MALWLLLKTVIQVVLWQETYPTCEVWGSLDNVQWSYSSRFFNGETSPPLCPGRWPLHPEADAQTGGAVLPGLCSSLLYLHHWSCAAESRHHQEKKLYLGLMAWVWTNNFVPQRPTALAKILGVYRIGYKNSQNNTEKKLDLLVMENLFYGRKMAQVRLTASALQFCWIISFNRNSICWYMTVFHRLILVVSVLDSNIHP